MVNSELDRQMMRRSIELAASAASAGNSPVGCVIVLDGRVLAEAQEESPAGDDPFAHAEILVVRTALGLMNKQDLSRVTLYSTNEPCFLCSYGIREARIGRIVFAVETPEIGGATSQYPLLKATRINRWGPAPQIESGLLAAEYRKALKQRK